MLTCFKTILDSLRVPVRYMRYLYVHKPDLEMPVKVACISITVVFIASLLRVGIKSFT